MNNIRFSNSCHYYQLGLCQSCDNLHLSFEDNLKTKVELLQTYFPGIPIGEFHHAPQMKMSRQKAKMAILPEPKGALGKVHLGILTMQKSQELMTCELYGDQFQKILRGICQFLEEAKIAPYNLQTKTGEGKFVIVSESNKIVQNNEVVSDLASLEDNIKFQSETGIYMVRIVLRSKEGLDRLKKLAGSFLTKNPEIYVLTANIFPEHKAAFEGAEEILLGNNQLFPVDMKDFQLNILPQSFFQVNQMVAFKLYHHVKERVRQYSLKKILDLYTGAGGFLHTMSDVIHLGVGVEISKPAIDAANHTKHFRGLNHLNFFAIDVDHFLRGEGGGSSVGEFLAIDFDAVIVNPPRNGLSRLCVDFLNSKKYPYVIYSSCNPETLKRDTELINENYQLLELTPFEMFTFSKHFEVVALFKTK